MHKARLAGVGRRRSCARGDALGWATAAARYVGGGCAARGGAGACGWAKRRVPEGAGYGGGQPEWEEGASVDRGSEDRAACSRWTPGEEAGCVSQSALP